MRSTAPDVIDRVADDHDVTSAKRVTARRGRALDRHRRQLFAARRIAAKGTEGKVAIELRRRQLEPRAALDVAGEQREHDTRVSAQCVEQWPDARQLSHARCNTFELAYINAPDLIEALIDRRLAHTRIAKHHVCDLRIGAA